MSNAQRKEQAVYKAEKKAAHKASRERRNLRKNSHNVWIVEKEKD